MIGAGEFLRDGKTPMTSDLAKRPLSERGRRHEKRGFTLVEFFVVLAIIALLVALLFPARRNAREAARRTQCKNNIKQIGLALHNYQDTYGVLPPAYTTDADGKPLHSWRTLILPYIEQKALYDRIDLSKPWNDPANVEISKTVVPVYQCPSTTSEPGQTTYLGVVADGGCLRPGESLTFSEVTDGPSSTLLVFEADPAHAVHWMEPADADEALMMSISPQSELPHAGGTHGLLGDGSVRFLSSKLSAEARRALITAAGGDGAALKEW